MALNANACYGQPKYVEALQGAPLKYGIFSVADLSDSGEAHWQQGIEWEPQLCGPASTYRCPTCAQNDDNEAPAKTYTDEGVPLETALPFTVYASFACSPIGNWDRAEERARAALLSGEERAVEAMMSAGVHASSNSLTGASTVNITPTPGTAVSIQTGLALLEQYLGANGKGEGTIVGTRRDILLANTDGKLIVREGDHLETFLGTPVAALAGITGTVGPNNTAAGPGESWLFALGSRPRIIRGGVFLTSERDYSLNTEDNNLNILAERTYVLGWDCFTAGVLVSGAVATAS
jgi:hypothetical protein